MVRVPANLPPKVMEELQTQYLRIKAFVSATRLWERVLTNQERQRLGGEVEGSHAKLGTVGMWQAVRGGSDARAVIDIAQALGFLDQTGYHWLLGEIGEKPRKVQEPLHRPTWDAREGELRLAGQVIRPVRVLGKPSNVQIILDAFQKAKWARQIRNPLPLGQQQLHQALRSLNKSLREIRFHSRNGGQIISWETA